YHMEEERRLFYVGMTRAKERLFLTAADYYGEGKREKKLSPFIFEALGDRLPSSELTSNVHKQLSFLDYQTVGIDEKKTDSPKIHIDYLSYSQIETFNICPLHYKLRYVLKVPTPPSASMSFGTSIHATLKDFYAKVAEGEKPTDKLIFEILTKDWVKEGYTNKKHGEDFFEKGKIYLQGYLKEGFNPKIIPAAMEQPFTVPLNLKDKSLKIGGKIDRVDVLPDGTVEIVDYKTGATIPTQKDVDSNLQLSFYALAATRIPLPPYNKKPEQVKLSLYFLDEQEKITTTRSVKDLEKAVEDIFKAKEEIEKSEFRCSGHMFCQNNCEYSLFCGAENQ
ncbi:MAG: hypothetical protein UX13_C0020G0001, partial [Candidatus Woesebacteria bacterium GW2011_GWB1_45_5]